MLASRVSKSVARTGSNKVTKRSYRKQIPKHRLLCGSGDQGQLGLGKLGDSVLKFVAPSWSDRFPIVELGNNHTLALDRKAHGQGDH